MLKNYLHSFEGSAKVTISQNELQRQMYDSAYTALCPLAQGCKWMTSNTPVSHLLI